MRAYPFLFVLVISLFLACKERAPKKYDRTLIDHQKIDAVFGNDVSNVLFNHLYVVVDSLTYISLIKDSPWKNSYAALDSGLPSFTPVSNNSSSCYLRGHRHYIEILGPNNAYDEPVGKSGIGFSLKNRGEHFHLGIEPKLGAMKDSLLYATETVKMPLDGQEHTWFKAFYTPSPGTALHTWYGFYAPSFLEHLHGKQHTSYSREAFLEPAYEKQKLFHSVEMIQLTCTPSDFRRIAQELGYLNCELVEKDEKVFTITSGDINIRMEGSNKIKYSRISQIRCRLNNADNSVNHIGNITITNKDKESIWNFEKFHVHHTN
ncbi:MAG: DUF5829 family protein [Bacteroidota bacterium]